MHRRKFRDLSVLEYFLLRGDLPIIVRWCQRLGIYNNVIDE